MNLTMPPEKISSKQFYLLLLAAYAFSIVVRMIWVFWASDFSEFWYNGELMINTNDGYYFASVAQKALEGMHAYNPRLLEWTGSATVFLTVVFAKLFSLESVVLYMPAVVSSLVVIPVMLIGRLYGANLFGFFAALLGSVTWSYYNRTMTGYYDTDMFSVMSLMFVLFFFLNAIEHRKLSALLLSALMIIAYPFLYDQGQALVFAMGAMFVGYLLLFYRGEEYTYQAMVMVALALLPLPWWIKTAGVALVYGAFHKEMLTHRQTVALGIVLVGVFFATTNVLSIIWAKISGYAIRGTEQEGGLHFFQVSQTVREAGHISFKVTAERVSGSIAGLVIAMIGYAAMVFRYRPMILALPLVGIGVFSVWGGLRFTVYAVPVAAMGAVYGFYLFTVYLRQFDAKYVMAGLQTVIVVAALFCIYRYGLVEGAWSHTADLITIAALVLVLGTFVFWRLFSDRGTSVAGLAIGATLLIIPNLLHVVEYKVPTVFTNDEVQLLEQLNAAASPEDYTLTWWDYGYPIWFYSDTNTLIDGGKHHHDNFLVASILNTSSQVLAANLSRLSVETYVSSGHKVVADQLLKKSDGTPRDLELMMMELSQRDFQLPTKTRDIYFYLPQRMLEIFPTVSLFSNIDLRTGEQGARPFFYLTRQSRDNGATVDLGSGVMFEKTSGNIRIGNDKVPLERIVVTQYDQQGRLHVSGQPVSPQGNLTLIVMRSHGVLLLLDRQMFNSLFIQLYVLENYDRSLFEPVVLSPYAKIYRLKR